MHRYLTIDPWLIIEEGFDPKNNRSSESIFSLGNGYMGQRASFEELYSGDSLLGNYIGGVYYPDPTKVGWWKNGYPEYYARIANLTNWNGIDINIAGETLDLAHCKVSEFRRILNMQEGFLERTFIAELPNGKQIRVYAQRLISMVDKKICAIKYSVTPLNFSDTITITPFLDTDAHNESSNWGEEFIEEISKATEKDSAFATIKTRRSDYFVTSGFNFTLEYDGKTLTTSATPIEQEHMVGNELSVDCEQDKTVTIYKYIANVTTRDYEQKQLLTICKKELQQAQKKGFNTILAEQKTAWEKIWEQFDVIIDGDPAIQQSIRFNLFQLSQSYTGDDPRLNVGPKGFTGEKYGATTQWDSEAYCVPFYLCTADPQISRNLLLYRYHHLNEAINNAKLLGFDKGAALFPMATVDGKEGQNEWEITFEEIHRNGAIAYAIYLYANYTDDKQYLIDNGLEVLIGISRFWQQRTTFSKIKNKYVILGVTGPNEYENNVNNNWHTNNIACWTMRYTIESLAYVKEHAPQQYKELLTKLNFNTAEETKKWQNIITNMHFPTDNKTGVFLQQDGYLDKEQIFADDLDPAIRPINQHWSWDRILRSCFIKQADTLQSIYFFMDQFNKDDMKRNFDFYEPRTVHESSLSPCIHAILAARLGYKEKAYELFLRTTRLDLDDYNNEVAEGCHITSMAGSWLAIAQGFGGMWVKDGQLSFAPTIIPEWQAYTFKTRFRTNKLTVKITAKQVLITNHDQQEISLLVYGKSYTIAATSNIEISLR